MSKRAALRKQSGEATTIDSRYVLAAGLFTAAGLIASGYLSYTYLASATLYCAGLGNCEAVHASAYARILGVPVAYTGFVSYVLVAALLFVRASRGAARTRYLALLGILAIGISGAVFSAYLTYVEFIVIDAVCPWCIISAIAITGVALVSYLDVREQLR